MRYTLCGQDARTTRVLSLISVLHKRITAVIFLRVWRESARNKNQNSRSKSGITTKEHQ
ncbi:MAG: hypothetical protein ACKPER_07175 [Dolichospermum sp.]